MVLTSVVCLLSSNRNPQPASFQVETHTAATVEVDVMPFLGRADWGGPFNAYYEALANLGSEYGDSRPFYTGCHVLAPNGALIPFGFSAVVSSPLRTLVPEPTSGSS